MTPALFAELLSSPENQLLDFKREHYKLIGQQFDDTHKLLKDIVSFCNTIRSKTAYIILGVSEQDGALQLIGINEPIDDNILQSKIKDKAYPRPKFLYYNYEFKHKVFGVIEIPVERYEEPIMPTIKLKGVEIGKIYHRQGSTNVEANGREVIQINNWITTVTSFSNQSEVIDGITELVSRLGARKEPLSSLFAKAIKIGEQIGDKELVAFCKKEIDGYRGVDTSVSDFEHRKVRLFVSPIRITEVQTFGKMDSQRFLKELKNDDNFKEIDAPIYSSLLDMEDIMDEQKSMSKGGYVVITWTAKGLFGDNIKNDYPLYLYTTYKSYSAVYLKSRKKITKMLLDKL